MGEGNTREAWERLTGGLEEASPSASFRGDDLSAHEGSISDLPTMLTISRTINTLSPEDRATRLVSDQTRSARKSTERRANPTYNYELGGEIARGGMGIIFKARQRSLQRDIALKKSLSPPSDLAAREKFVAEARVTAFLDHPNIVPVHDLGVAENGDILLAMKMVGGKSWKEMIHREPESDDRDYSEDMLANLAILNSVCNAISYAHNKGIVHNDIKPANVMVGKFGEAFVMDWGMAVNTGNPEAEQTFAPYRDDITRPMGTPNYMPPELAKGEGQKIGPWTDTYLLGAILYEIVMGRPPHMAESAWLAVLKASHGILPDFSDRVPQDLRRICSKALSPSIRDRYQSVGEFQEDLRDYLRNRETKEYLWVCGAFILLFLLLGALVGLLLQHQIELNRTQQTRHDSIEAAMELRKSSEDMISEARTYVMTGDEGCEHKYWQLRDIRDGKSIRADGTMISLRDKMKELGFTREELAKLTESEDKSNALMATERAAMNAFKGLFDDGSGSFAIAGTPDTALARELLFDQAYRSKRSAIMRPIGEFLMMINERTNAAVTASIVWSYAYLALIGLVIISLIVGSILHTLRLYRRVRERVSR